MYKDLVSLTKQVFSYGTGRLLVNSIGIILIPIYTRVLTVADYGIISSLAPITTLLMFVFNFGQAKAVMKYDADFDDVNERKAAHGSSWIFVIFMAFIFTLLLGLLSLFGWDFVFPDIPLYPFAPLLLGAAFMNAFKTVPLALLRVRGKAVLYSATQFFQFLTLTSIIILFVVFLRQGAAGQMTALLIAAAIFAVIYVVISLPEIKLTINFTHLKKYIAFGMPVVPGTVFFWLLTYSNHILLQRMASLEEIGLYALAFKFGLVMDTLIFALLSAWEPMFYQKGRSEDGPAFFAQASTYFIFIILGISAGVLVGAKEVIRIISTPAYFGAEKVVWLVVIGFIPRAMYQLSSLAIYLKEKNKHIPIATLVVAVLNIIISILLIPKYGMIGAALSTLIAYVVLFVWVFILSQKFYPIPYQFSRIGRIILVFALSAWGLMQIHFESDVLTLILRLSLLPVMVFVGLYVFRVPEKRELSKIRQMFKRK